MLIQDLMNLAIEKKSSDIHLKSNKHLILRINGNLISIEEFFFSTEEIKNLIYSVMSKYQIEKFEKEKELDFSYDLENHARFRINVFYHTGAIGAILRIIPLKISTIEELNLPLILKDIALKESGLILCTGPTGCGKSTTLSSMIDYINVTKSCHIVTIENPIEFIFQDKKSFISQRELGIDTNSLSNALKHVLRQDPNVILVGEMRDLETISTAITAAETGHLVLSTLHTIDAKQTIDRILDQFPANQQQIIQRQLSQILIAIFSQRLVKSSSGENRIPIVEIMINSPSIKSLIANGKIEEILDMIENSKRYYGMQSFNQALIDLYKEKKINLEDAINISPKPDDLKLRIAGLSSGGDLIEKNKEDAFSHLNNKFL
ncbi:MAG: type IV pilus twitching motility protein PilT [bacterium]